MFWGWLGTFSNEPLNYQRWSTYTLPSILPDKKGNSKRRVQNLSLNTDSFFSTRTNIYQFIKSSQIISQMQLIFARLSGWNRHNVIATRWLLVAITLTCDIFYIYMFGHKDIIELSFLNKNLTHTIFKKHDSRQKKNKDMQLNEGFITSNKRDRNRIKSLMCQFSINNTTRNKMDIRSQRQPSKIIKQARF